MDDIRKERAAIRAFCCVQLHVFRFDLAHCGDLRSALAGIFQISISQIELNKVQLNPTFYVFMSIRPILP